MNDDPIIRGRTFLRPESRQHVITLSFPNRTRIMKFCVLALFLAASLAIEAKPEFLRFREDGTFTVLQAGGVCPHLKK